MSKVDTHQKVNKSEILTDSQTAKLIEAGFTSEQIAAFPSVRGLTDEQILLADSLGLFPHIKDEGLTLEEIAALPDDTIDLSDIPELDEEFWKNAKLVKPKKELVSIRLDPDILAYFRRPGVGYQSRINAVLRLWMKAHPNPPQ
jgi:uncharacterized protein (DUF4415 family)